MRESGQKTGQGPGLELGGTRPVSSYAVLSDRRYTEVAKSLRKKQTFWQEGEWAKLKVPVRRRSL